jgi:N-acetylneuraminate synthase
MIIDKDIKKFLVFSENSIIHALDKISKNKKRVVFITDETGTLEGILTDGDFRRWITSQEKIDLDQPVKLIANTEYTAFSISENPGMIESALCERIQFIPLLDTNQRIVAVAVKETKDIIIDHCIINKDAPCFIIAEIGNNHNGNLDLAKKLVEMAVQAGADCAKFQMRDLTTLYRQPSKSNQEEDLGTEYTVDLLKKNQLADDDLFRIFDYCKSRQIIPLCTPWDEVSLEKLDVYGMPAFKIASADLINHEFLQKAAAKHKPLICSTGMAEEHEIIESISLLNTSGTPHALLHCNSTYPAPFKDINLNYIKRLQKLGNCIIGYSGHERGIAVPIAAVALGAKIVEKHITLDRTMEGNDHKVSLLPEEFSQMVQGIRETELALGTPQTGRFFSQGEMMNRENLAKSLVAACSIKKGETIKSEMIAIKSPGKGLAPYKKKQLAGLTAIRDFKPGDFFFTSDIQKPSSKPRKYHFNRPWGIPLRFHDFHELVGKTNLDLVEFHLSYRDLDVNIENLFNEPHQCGYIVHCPELFRNDHILDLSANDPTYRTHSIKELQKVIDLTVRLNPFFPKTISPFIVTNMGGFSLDCHVAQEDRSPMYERIKDALKKLDLKGTQIIPQSMPPFPWHFGGQRYHNLFVDPDEIQDFCKEMKMKICLDISHSKLACNFYGWSLNDFIEKTADFIAHLHLADAKDHDGEGLQISSGEIDFPDLFKQLDRLPKNISFIPEIWQGHKNCGEGFWYALDQLETFHKRAQ